MIRYFQYTRKSTEGDERQYQSIPDQESVLGRIVEQDKLNVIQKVAEARSAKIPFNRPLFEEMLKSIEKGKADGILCWHINRLSRNPVDSGRLSWLLQEGKLKVIKTPDREFRSDDNVVVMAVENAVANQYILDLRKAITRAQSEKAGRGWYPLKPPPGYKTNPITKEIEPDEPRFSLMRKVVDLLLMEQCSISHAWRELNRLGFEDAFSYKKKSGRKMGKSRFFRLLSNTFYYGEFTFRGERHLGRHVPLLSRDEFDQIQKVIHRPSQEHRQKHSFAFQGMIHCGHCGCLVTAEKKFKFYRGTGRTVEYTYYHCTGKKGCQRVSVREEFLLDEIKRALEKSALEPQIGKWILATDRALRTRETEWQSHLLGRHKQDLQVQELKLDRLIQLRLDGELSQEEFVSYKNPLVEQIDKLKATILRISSVDLRATKILHNSVNFALEASRAFTVGNAEEKGRIARVFARNYVLTDHKLTFEINPLLIKLSRFEPPEKGADQVGGQHVETAFPTKWAWREELLTLLMEGGVPSLSLEDIPLAQSVTHLLADSTDTSPDGNMAA